MGEALNDMKPIWRTPLAGALVGWMLVVIGVTLGSSRLMENMPGGVLPLVVAGVYLVPIPILLVWGFWTMLREPVTGWLAPTVLLAFVGGFIPAFVPLFDAGVSLNFLTRRPAYDSIVAEVQDGRLSHPPDANGRVRGRRGDIRYSFAAARSDVIQFDWSNDSSLVIMVVYDRRSCRGPRTRPRAPGEPLRISIYDRRLGGYYCYYRGIA